MKWAQEFHRVETEQEIEASALSSRMGMRGTRRPYCRMRLSHRCLVYASTVVRGASVLLARARPAEVHHITSMYFVVWHTVVGGREKDVHPNSRKWDLIGLCTRSRSESKNSASIRA